MKSQCFCLTIEDISHPLVQGATLLMLDALPPSPWKPEPISSLKSKHRVHSVPLCCGSSEIRKTAVTVGAKSVRKPGVHRRKKDEERSSLDGGPFSHLEPSEYIVAYRAAHGSGIGSTNISTRQDAQGQAGTMQQKRRAGDKRLSYFTFRDQLAREWDKWSIRWQSQQAHSFMLIKGSSIYCPHFYSPTTYVTSPMHTDSQTHKTTVCTAAPMTTVTVEHRRHGSKGRPLVIVSSSDRPVLQSTVSPVVQLVTPSATAPVINSKMSESMSKQQPSTSLCECIGGRVPGSVHSDADSGSHDDGVLVSDFIPALQPQGKIQGSLCGRLLAARWRSHLDAGKGVTQWNLGCVDNEVKIKGLHNGHSLVPNGTKGEQHYAEADSCSRLSSDQRKTSVYPTHALTVPKLAQTTVVKGSSVSDPRLSTASCGATLERSCYSTTPQPTSKGRLPCLVGAKTSSESNLIDHEQQQTVTHHISPLPRRASSAVVRREKEDFRPCRAQVKARHHEKCIPRSFARRVAASNWQSFSAEEFDVVTSRVENHHNSPNFHARK